MNKKYKLMAILLIAMLFITACGSNDTGSNDDSDNDNKNESNFRVGMVTDTGGVDDKSFNQSSWEGMQRFGKENNLTEKTDFNYLQSRSESDYEKNFREFVKQDFNLIFGIGFLTEKAITNVANENPDSNFAIIDTIISDVDNITSITFSEQEGSFLVGVVAAMTTNTNKVGFLGGVESSLISKFEAGYVAGVKAVNPDIEVEIKYAGAFDKADLGKVSASAMFNSGVDIIYHAAGATGKGVFSEAKAIKEADPSRDVWVIGVDRDQFDEGWLSDNETNITLTSMVKRVDLAVFDVSTRALEGRLNSGEHLEYGLAEDSVGISDSQDNLTPEIISAVEDFKARILSGEIVVPITNE